jgi:hypothetical protein
MSGDVIADRVDALLQALSKREPIASDLGTPQLDTAAAELREILRLGPGAKAHLLRAAQNGPARRAVWAVLALAESGSPGLVPALRRLRAEYQARADKTEWDFAVIGQINNAERRLGRSG